MKKFTITENKLRRLIRDIIIEGGRPDPSFYNHDEEILSEMNVYWEKVKPSFPEVGFNPKEDNFDYNADQASKILGCSHESLLIYMPLDDNGDYDEDYAMEYADLFLFGIIDSPGVNINDYVCIEDKTSNIYYIFTISELENHLVSDDVRLKIFSSLNLQSKEERKKVKELIKHAKEEYYSDISSGAMTYKTALNNFKDYLKSLYDFGD